MPDREAHQLLYVEMLLWMSRAVRLEVKIRSPSAMQLTHETLPKGHFSRGYKV